MEERDDHTADGRETVKTQAPVSGNWAPAEKYEGAERIGNGGSGTVYRVWDRNLEKYMAVKEIEAPGMWEREKEVLKELRHPALPVITDCFEKEGKKYLVMDYIEGITLLEYLQKYGRVSQTRATAWARELSAVLCYLHGQPVPIIYRDMKPSNVMIDKDGRIKLIDFGTVFLRHRDGRKQYIRAGTYGYAAPEQMGEDAFELTDERTDIYGLGATLHHMLTGKDPTGPPYLLSPVRSYDRALSTELERIVKKAVMPKREQRYGSMRQFKEELERFEERERKKQQGKWMAAAVYFFSLILSGLGFALSYYKAEYFQLVPEKRALWEERMLLCAVCVLLLCLLRWLCEGISGYGKRRQIRTYKSVYLSEKRNAGLPLLLFTVALTASVCTTVSQASETPAAMENILPVTVRDEAGRKLLIRFDAEYCAEKGLRLFLPPEDFGDGEGYVLKLECVGREKGERRSRTFYVRGGKGG